MLHDRIFDAWSFVVIIGILHGLVLSIIFLSKARNRPANLVIGLLILLLVWHHLQSLSVYLNFYREFPHFYGVDLGPLFLLGPFFYFFVRFSTKTKTRWKKHDLLHLTPFIATLIVRPVIFQSTVEKAQNMRKWLRVNRYNDLSLRAELLIDDLIFLAESVQMLIYMGLSLVLIHRLHKKVNDSNLELAKNNLTWLRNLTYALIGVILISFITQKSLYLYLRFYYHSLDYIYILPMTILIYGLGIFVLRKPTILSEQAIAHIKYRKALLNAQQLEEYLARLQEYTKTEKPYLDPDLKLGDLAQQLGIQTNHLSQALNQGLSKNFFDYINGHRVEEAKRLLGGEESANQGLLSIAMESGFNNKASFNNYFKKLTGLTPSAYRKKIQGNL